MTTTTKTSKANKAKTSKAKTSKTKKTASGILLVSDASQIPAQGDCILQTAHKAGGMTLARQYRYRPYRDGKPGWGVFSRGGWNPEAEPIVEASTRSASMYLEPGYSRRVAMAVFSDGQEEAIQEHLDNRCPLGRLFIGPLCDDGKGDGPWWDVGTMKLGQGPLFQFSAKWIKFYWPLRLTAAELDQLAAFLRQIVKFQDPEDRTWSEVQEYLMDRGDFKKPRKPMEGKKAKKGKEA